MDFVVKSKKELEALNSEELHAYYVEKLNHEKNEIESRVKSLEDEKNTEAFEKLTNEVKELKDTQFQTLKNALEEQGRVVKGLREGKLSGGDMLNAEGTIEKAMIDNLENFKAAKEGKHEFKFDVKVAGDMTLSGNVTGTVPQAQRLDGVNDIAEREARVYSAIPKLTTSGNTIEWVYETAQDGTIDGTAEGDTKDQIDNDFVVASVSLVKRAAFFKVSTEMLDDAAFMGGWLRNKLIVRLFLDIDNQVLNGSGAANQVNGIITQATAFAAGAFAGTVDNANDADSLVVAANQIRIANHNGALKVYMHPSDVAALKLVKLSATDKRYVDRLMMMGSTLSLDGMPIIETTAVTAGDFLIGDFAKATVVEKSAISVEVGLDGNDFTKNMRTILAEWRGQCFIQNNDTSAFVTGTFATTNAALETP